MPTLSYIFNAFNFIALPPVTQKSCFYIELLRHKAPTQNIWHINAMVKVSCLANICTPAIFI